MNDRITLSIVETAHAIGVSRTTVYCLLRAGAISSKKIGRRRLILTESILSLIQS